MSGKRGRKSSQSNKQLVALIIAAVVLAATGIGVYYTFHTPCNIRIVSCCLSMGGINIVTQGNCHSFEIRIIGPLPEKSVVYKIDNVEPGHLIKAFNLNYGNYTVQLVYKGRVLDEITTTARLAPYIMQAKSALLPNGTVLVNYQTETSPCFPSYGVKNISVYIVYYNHSIETFNFTGHWPPGKNFILHLSKPIDTENIAYAYVTLEDTLGNKINASLIYPK